jgi:probable HAF family extracellular repeat protein
LGLPDRSTNSAYSAVAINDAGQVVGNARIGGADGVDRAYRWTPGGRVDYIVGAKDKETVARDVNSSGQVAGVLWPTSDESQPFVWDEETGLRALSVGVGAGFDSVYGMRINDRGQVSGTLSVGVNWDVAFRMEPDGTVSEAPLKQTVASDMNEAGEVVLTVEDESGSGGQLYVWQRGARLVEGGPISWSSSPTINDGGLVVGATATTDGEGACGFVWDTRTGRRTTIGIGVSPSDVNGRGQVTGVWSDGDVRHAFWWDSSSGLVDLGTVPGYDDSYGEAINDQGQVIGSASRWGSGDARTTSFLWDPSTGLIELRPLHADDSTFVNGINSSGVVVGGSGPVDPEEGVVLEGEPVIWYPIG